MDAKQYGNRPAFPHAAMTEQVTVPTQHPGMTVRDELAKAALTGLLASTPGWPDTGDMPEIARRARIAANALVAELAKDGAQ